MVGTEIMDPYTVRVGRIDSSVSGERLHRFIVLPSREELKVFLDFAGPIAFALFGKVIF